MKTENLFFSLTEARFSQFRFENLLEILHNTFLQSPLKFAKKDIWNPFLHLRILTNVLGNGTHKFERFFFLVDLMASETNIT